MNIVHLLDDGVWHALLNGYGHLLGHSYGHLLGDYGVGVDTLGVVGWYGKVRVGIRCSVAVAKQKSTLVLLRHVDDFVALLLDGWLHLHVLLLIHWCHLSFLGQGQSHQDEQYQCLMEFRRIEKSIT